MSTFEFELGQVLKLVRRLYRYIAFIAAVSVIMTLITLA